MCRLLGYLGPPITLDRWLIKPEHSLIEQSYQPREMETALLNADGFGLGWHHPDRTEDAFVYRSVLPIWNDVNLSPLSRYIESGCALAYIRSATPGQAISIDNCQPFQRGRLLFIHNGFIEDFRQSLYRPIRDRLCDVAYHSIQGSTDSEHIFALLIHQLEAQPSLSLSAALDQTLKQLCELSHDQGIRTLANVIVSDGQQLVFSRFATSAPQPSLYWLRDDFKFPKSVIVASEPLFDADWTVCQPSTLVQVSADIEIQSRPLDFA
ncbi:MAG: ergothioneine biosynthesis protein EgtC [Leptolyngbyaceae cyanobacterium SM1_1_3]|nr:ergothioneine biosynthesis protein EgtC [Leptolyngbyaceae cyanobacterium SM1_1_3]NJN04975.1 ergothioneine biosynthesis protein EgtC [Leptolyngbyaceae cyanobacterium RM1_1_2]NJO11875.1 ergothioneine biosynthesis protein EgtC [Leptolyngbyaceae cyanobacterium SL_1_1]